MDMKTIDKEIKKGEGKLHKEEKALLKKNPYTRGLRAHRIRQQLGAGAVRILIAAALLFLAGAFGVIPCPVWLRVILYILAGLEALTAVMRLYTACTWGYQESLFRYMDELFQDSKDADMTQVEAFPEFLCRLTRTPAANGLFYAPEGGGGDGELPVCFFCGDMEDVFLCDRQLAWVYPDRHRTMHFMPQKHAVRFCPTVGNARFLPVDSPKTAQDLCREIARKFRVPCYRHPVLEKQYRKDQAHFRDCWADALREELGLSMAEAPDEALAQALPADLSPKGDGESGPTEA